MGVFWEVSFWYFFFLTCLIGGGAAWLSGRDSGGHGLQPPL